MDPFSAVVGFIFGISFGAIIVAVLACTIISRDTSAS